MSKYLDSIDDPKELRALDVGELPAVAEEMREFIVDAVSRTGGHLASSLGAVDMTVALHYVFNTPMDKLIWDVGHQSYPHKLLTGRKDRFHTLRKLGGISGFPKIKESPYDAFGTGHSSTSISAGLGMAAARDLAGGDFKVVSIIGDGSMTAGLAFEGLNQAGHLKKDFIVILNDNEMSISPNVGALAAFLSRKVTGRFARSVKKEVDAFVKSIPAIGGHLSNIVKKAEDSIIAFLTPGMLFEGLGFHYVGPVDGHDIEALVRTFEDIKQLDCPVLLHVLTKKGKGYAPAEEEPSRFHGLGPFDKVTGDNVTGKSPGSASVSYTAVFSDSLIEIAEREDKVVAITAAMPEGTGLNKFAERFPDRFFDVGIAEQHAVTFAAGMAKEGFIPVTAIYSTFLQRAYDEIIHDVCLQGLPVVFALDRAGLVGADGPTHHGTFDISYLRHIPGLVVTAPKDAAELRQMLWSAVKYGGPTSIRYPRGASSAEGCEEPFEVIPVGKGEVVRDGSDLTILAIGTMVETAMEAAEALAKEGIKAAVVNARFVKPLDEELILTLAAKTGKVLTLEENALQGGFGSAVIELCEERGVSVEVKRLAISDTYVEHGTQAELLSRLGLDAPGVATAARALLGVKQSRAAS